MMTFSNFVQNIIKSKKAVILSGNSNKELARGILIAFLILKKLLVILKPN
jgi:hypothetical protein